VPTSAPSRSARSSRRRRPSRSRASPLKLGKIALKNGFAVAAKAPKKRCRPKGWVKVAKSGGPLGAGQSRLRQGVRREAEAARSRRRDAGRTDGDGVPNTFDFRRHGNRTLDGVDPATSTVASTAGLFSDVQVMMSRSVNANAGGITRAQVDAFVKNNTSLNFYLDPGARRRRHDLVGHGRTAERLPTPPRRSVTKGGKLEPPATGGTVRELTARVP